MAEETKSSTTIASGNDEIIENPEAELTHDELLELRGALRERRESVIKEYQRHVAEASEDTENLPDEMDIAERQSRHAYLFRLADKEAKLLREIDHALAKFARGKYGICEGTGDPIGVRRLRSRPWTRYSLAHKEELEKKKGKRTYPR